MKMFHKTLLGLILMSISIVAMQQVTIIGNTFTDELGNTILRYTETSADGITEAEYVIRGPSAPRYSVSTHSTDVTDEGTFTSNKEFFGDEARDIFNDLQARYRQEKG